MAKHIEKQFEVTFLIGASKLTTITELVAGECTLVGMREITPKEPAKKEQRPRQFHFYGGRRFKGISAEDLLIIALADGPKSTSRLYEIFEARGFAPTSASPACSNARKAGVVTGDGNGWLLTDTGKAKIAEARAREAAGAK